MCNGVSDIAYWTVDIGCVEVSQDGCASPLQKNIADKVKFLDDIQVFRTDPTSSVLLEAFQLARLVIRMLSNIIRENTFYSHLFHTFNATMSFARQSNRCAETKTFA